MKKRTASDWTFLVDFVLVVALVENEAGISQGNQQQIHHSLRSQNEENKPLVLISELSVWMRDEAISYK